MKRFFTTPAIALALVLVAGTGTQAAPLPSSVQWSYNFAPTMSPMAIFADGNPAAGVTFTNEPTGFAKGNSDIVATNLRVFSAAAADAPDTIAAGGYGLKLTMSTIQSGHTYTANLLFNGTLSGDFSKESANIVNEFGTNSTQVVTLGSTTFTVSLYDNKGRPLYTPPGPPDQANAGSIAAHVTLSVGDSGGPPPVPEPSTMLLSALGLSFLGGAAWRKRKARLVARGA